MTSPFETSPGLDALSDLKHGFFGREGGVSRGDFASLNVSDSQGDDPEAVAENRSRVTGALVFPRHSLALVRQIHSNSVVKLTAVPNAGERPEADAMVTNVPDLVLGIMTADCTPILLADPQSGVIGAIHAGWKGALSGIVTTTVAAMAQLGATPTRIIAAIGPTISAENYEVGADFANALIERHPAAERHIFTPPDGTEHFDLPGFIEDQLTALGISEIDRVGGCTYGSPERYFSHRYATHHQHRTGRQIAVIALR